MWRDVGVCGGVELGEGDRCGGEAKGVRGMGEERGMWSEED